MGATPRKPGVAQELREEWRDFAERMRDQGWTFEEGDKHPKAFAPDGLTWTTLAGTPGDVRAWRNARAVFRRWRREQGLEPGI